MKSLHFDDSDEPDSFRFQFMDDVKSILKNTGATMLDVKFDNKEDFYRILNKAHDFIEHGMSVHCTSIAGNYEVVIEDDEDLEEQKQPKKYNQTKKKKKAVDRDGNEKGSEE